MLPDQMYDRRRYPTDLPPLGDRLAPTKGELAMYLILAPIAAEFASDPMSVQCFDLRLVAQAKACVSHFEKTFGGWMAKNRDQVRDVRAGIESWGA